MNNIIRGEFLVKDELLKKRTDIEFKSDMYSSGRVALRAIMNDICSVGGVIHVPNFLCSSVTQTILDTGWGYKFYNLNNNLEPSISEFEISNEKPVILLINYFGLIDIFKISTELKKKYPSSILILDKVQDYYGNIDTNIDYAFNSLRKWFPCPDGAKPWKRDYGYLRPRDMKTGSWFQYKLAGNILKNYVGFIDDSITLELIEKGETLLDSDYQVFCSEASQRVFSNLDLDGIAAVRRNNARILHEGLQQLGIRHLYKEDAVPLFIPILISNRDKVRRKFFSEKIFAPVHWKSAGTAISGENELYEKELSLIVDQRYSLKDMLRQLKVLETTRIH